MTEYVKREFAAARNQQHLRHAVGMSAIRAAVARPYDFINRRRKHTMELTGLFLSELDREVERSRHALEQVPEGKHDWKPHEKSMVFGYLAQMVATIPTWVTMIIKQDELDVAPKSGRQPQAPLNTSAEYLDALKKAAADAREALKGTNEEFLMTNWRLLAGGQVMSELPRHEMIRDTINHWAHHRGQMTVYLRLMGAKVPALYGPSADDKSFG
jgi:uncharacterized damage-inducible protein DinB